MWSFPESTHTKNKNKKLAIEVAAPKIPLQKTKTPASIDENEQQQIIQVFSAEFPNTYRAITNEEAKALLQKNSITKYF